MGLQFGDFFWWLGGAPCRLCAAQICRRPQLGNPALASPPFAAPCSPASASTRPTIIGPLSHSHEHAVPPQAARSRPRCAARIANRRAQRRTKTARPQRASARISPRFGFRSATQDPRERDLDWETRERVFEIERVLWEFYFVLLKMGHKSYLLNFECF